MRFLLACILLIIVSCGSQKNKANTSHNSNNNEKQSKIKNNFVPRYVTLTTEQLAKIDPFYLEQCSKSDMDYSSYVRSKTCTEIENDINYSLAKTENNTSTSFVKFTSGKCEKVGYVVWNCVSNFNSVQKVLNTDTKKLRAILEEDKKNYSIQQEKINKKKIKDEKDAILAEAKKAKEDEIYNAKVEKCENGNAKVCWDLYIENKKDENPLTALEFLEKSCSLGIAKACNLIPGKKEEKARLAKEAAKIAREEREEKTRLAKEEKEAQIAEAKKNKEEQVYNAKIKKCENGNAKLCWDLYILEKASNKITESALYLEKACSFGHKKACEVALHQKEIETKDAIVKIEQQRLANEIKAEKDRLQRQKEIDEANAEAESNHNFHCNMANLSNGIVGAGGCPPADCPGYDECIRKSQKTKCKYKNDGIGNVVRECENL